ncbi:hypothetical protein JCM10295v2_002588 [Rhodotorula toruloides]
MPPDMPAPSQTSPLASEETTSTPPPAPDPKQPLDTAGKAEALVSEATKAGKMDGQASEQQPATPIAVPLPEPPRNLASLDTALDELDVAPQPLSASSARSAASPRLPSRPPSRPSSRPPSLSRLPSSYRPRSSSAVSRLSASVRAGPGDPKRLSVSTNPSLHSPHLTGAPASPRIPEDTDPDSAAAASSSRRRSQIDTSGWTHPSSSSAAPTLAAHLTPLIIRDYAYPRTDPRFEGKQLPEDVEAERRFREEEALGRKRSSWDDEDEDGPVGGAVGPGFHWGFVTSHTSDFPAASDLSDNDSDTPDGYSFHDPEVDPSGHSNGDDELGDFVPGVYSAVYVFEPELDTEMRLEAGELVSVFERQCAGWVQAGRIVNNELTGEIGLVPENYLALVEAHEGVIDWTTGEDGDVHGTMHLQVTDGAQEAGKAGEAVEAKEGGAKENEAAANGAEPSQDPPTEPTHESSQ